MNKFFLNNEIQNFELDVNEQFWMDEIQNCHEKKYFCAHRHSFYEILIFTHCDDGKYVHSIDFISYPIKSGLIYFIAPNQVHSWSGNSYNKEYSGYMITFTEEFLLKNNKIFDDALLKLFNPLNKKPFIKFTPKYIYKELPILSIMANEYKTNKNEIYILKTLLESLIYYMARFKIEENYYIDINTSRIIKIRELIEKYYIKERNINFYARKMQLSAKRLNETIKEISGQTVIQLLHARLLLEAKRELINKQNSIQDISDFLGFQNASYFSRFFKKNEGISPSFFSEKLL